MSITRRCIRGKRRFANIVAIAFVAATVIDNVESSPATSAGAPNPTGGTTGVANSRAPRIRSAFGPPAAAPGTLGGPLSGLTTTQANDFANGLEEFGSVDTPESGLGPIFNDNSCAACRSVPVTGGGSTRFVTRFGHLSNGAFDPLSALRGSLLQARAIDPAVQEAIPAQANVVAHRVTTPLFGAGLIEAIPDDVILANAARPKADGVTGRASTVFDVASGQTRMGRFGWKAQQATLLAFAGDAYLNEMGIANRLFPLENAPNGNVALLAEYDAVADPEDVTDPATGKADIDRFADFMRLLAPPPSLPSNESARMGAVIFASAGCAVCHTPSMKTGRNPIAALNEQQVNLYSDLLLDDMGALGDGIAQGTAGPRDLRTAPLWGMRLRTAYLHDGRATTASQAILAHDGEVRPARDRFGNLSPPDKAHLLEFLRTL